MWIRWPATLLFALGTENSSSAVEGPRDFLEARGFTIAELSAGPHATTNPAERARRQDRLQRAEATFAPLPVDTAVARADGRVYAAVGAAGLEARGRRAVDFCIAADCSGGGTALAHAGANWRTLIWVAAIHRLLGP